MSILFFLILSRVVEWFFDFNTEATEFLHIQRILNRKDDCHSFEYFYFIFFLINSMFVFISTQNRLSVNSKSKYEIDTYQIFSRYTSKLIEHFFFQKRKMKSNL